MNLKQRIRNLRKYDKTQWMVAKEIGVSEQTLIRWLRTPEDLEINKVKMIEKAIEKLQKEAK